MAGVSATGYISWSTGFAELFDLKGEQKLPYKGFVKVEAYLITPVSGVVLTVSLEVLMIFNSIHQHPWQATRPFRFILD
jgi:hypothetical protein